MSDLSPYEEFIEHIKREGLAALAEYSSTYLFEFWQIAEIEQKWRLQDAIGEYLATRT